MYTFQGVSLEDAETQGWGVAGHLTAEFIMIGRLLTQHSRVIHKGLVLVVQSMKNEK
jgi:hypothetical protein